MAFELVVGFVVLSLDGRVLERPVHPLDLAVGPRVSGLGQAMFDVEIGATRLRRHGKDRAAFAPASL